MSEITVYTTEPCSFCARVKGLLKRTRRRVRRGQPLEGPRRPRGAGAAHRDDELPPGDRRRTAARRLRRGPGRGRRAAAWTSCSPPEPEPPARRRSRGAAGRSRTRRCPRPATTIFTIVVPHAAHGSPARRCTRNWSWKEPRTPSTWRKSSIVAPRASMPALSASITALAQARVLLAAISAPGRPQRVDAGAEQRLVGVDVADAGDPALVEQQRLDRRPSAPSPARAGARR